MKPVYQITLTPAAGNHLAPPIVRLRRLLKASLRGYGLRCVSAKEVQPTDAVTEKLPDSANAA